MFAPPLTTRGGRAGSFRAGFGEYFSRIFFNNPGEMSLDGNFIVSGRLFELRAKLAEVRAELTEIRAQFVNYGPRTV